MLEGSPSKGKRQRRTVIWVALCLTLGLPLACVASALRTPDRPTISPLCPLDSRGQPVPAHIVESSAGTLVQCELELDQPAIELALQNIVPHLRMTFLLLSGLVLWWWRQHHRQRRRM